MQRSDQGGRGNCYLIMAEMEMGCEGTAVCDHCGCAGKQERFQCRTCRSSGTLPQLARSDKK